MAGVKKTILIVEDTAAMATTLSTKLEHAGFATTVAVDGEEALKILETKIFDLIILDLIMPKVSGFEVLETLQKRKNTIPVIVSSNLGQEEDCAKVLALGAAEYFVKAETSVAEIVRYVTEFLEHPKTLTTSSASHIQGNALARHIRTALATATLRAYLEEIEPLKKGFDLLNDHVIITDAHANIIYANKAAERNTGFPLGEMLGKNPADLWGGRMPKTFYESLWHTISVEKKPFVGEVQNVAKNGTDYWQELHIAPIVDAAGDVRFFIGIEPNITERKAKEQFKEEFVSILGHQLKNPLTSIHWALENLNDAQACTPKEREVLKNVYKENQGLMTLVGDLLVLARLEDGGVAKESLDLQIVLAELIASLQREYPGVVLTWQPKLKECLVYGHATLVKQLFIDIIGNACKYANTEKGHVEVSLFREDRNYIFSCRDNGIGIPADEQQKIFERFFRASNAVTKAGSGLGLFITKFIANQYGWDVSFTSTVGKGTMFRVEIPVKENNQKI